MQKPQTNSNFSATLPLSIIYDSLVSIIDKNIDLFPAFLTEAEVEYKEASLIKKSKIEQEDDITIPFGRFFRNLNSEFDFEPQSKTPENNATTDIGIIARKYSRHKVICFVEAKRLPTPRASQREECEYVCYKNSTKQGGIERFKTEKHAGKEKIPFSLMLGYIQEDTHSHWLATVNGWIEEQITLKSNKTISWSINEKLAEDAIFKKNRIHKFKSKHTRRTLSDIDLLHYWIDLK